MTLLPVSSRKHEIRKIPWAPTSASIHSPAPVSVPLLWTDWALAQDRSLSLTSAPVLSPYSRLRHPAQVLSSCLPITSLPFHCKSPSTSNIIHPPFLKQNKMTTHWDQRLDSSPPAVLATTRLLRSDRKALKRALASPVQIPLLPLSPESSSMRLHFYLEAIPTKDPSGCHVVLKCEVHSHDPSSWTCLHLTQLMLPSSLKLS